jgi:ribosome-binding factor A
MKVTPILNFVYDDGSRLASKISEICEPHDEVIEDLDVDGIDYI